MEIIISTKQLERLKSTYCTKYVDNSELYKGPRICNGINQNLNKLKIIDVIEQYGDLINKYSYIFKREKPIGEGEDGSPIQLYTIDKTKTQKPIILIVGGIHGDEKTSIYGIYETVKFLLLGSKWSRFITSNFVVQIIPCLNVYGFNNNKRNNSNNKDLNRDFIKTTQKETKALTNYINKNKDRIKIILDSHNAYNEEFVSCKQEMKYFEEYEDVAFKLNLFLNGKYENSDKKSFLWISRSQNDGTLSDFINKNKFIGHTVESPRSLVKEIHYPNPINYEDGAEVTVDLLINLMYIYGKMFNEKLLTEGKAININENDINELQAFHGSHAVFDKFNHKKFLSSGADSQSFGWGTYVTDDTQIAKDYAELETKDNMNISYDGKVITKEQLKEKINTEMKKDFPELFKQFNSVIVDISKELIDFEGYDKDKYQGFYTVVKNLFLYNKEDINGSNVYSIEKLIVYLLFCNHNVQVGNIDIPHIIYEVDVPDDNGTNYIEWYEHFPSQYMERVLYTMASLKPKYIQMMCQSSYIFAKGLGWHLQDKDNSNFDKIINIIANEKDYRTFFGGNNYTVSVKPTGNHVYMKLVEYMGSPKAASLFLMQCGFDGIKYPTYTKYKKPEGRDGNHKNYVIFDANKVKITKREEITNNETV